MAMLLASASTHEKMNDLAGVFIEKMEREAHAIQHGELSEAIQ
jgi:hypothetical protein